MKNKKLESDINYSNIYNENLMTNHEIEFNNNYFINYSNILMENFMKKEKIKDNINNNY